MTLEDRKPAVDEKDRLKYGYARVSTNYQDPQRQIEQLVRDGIDPAFIVSEKVSGMKPRPKLDALLAELRDGDELHVVKLDRLCRDRDEIYEVVPKLHKQGITVVFDGRKFDPYTLEGRILFEIVATFAETEVNNTRERTLDALASRRAAGKQMGRKRALSPEQEEVLIPLIQDGYLAAELVTLTGVSRSTISRLQRRVRQMEAEAGNPERARKRRQEEARTAKELQARREKTLAAAQRKIDALRPKEEGEAS